MPKRFGLGPVFAFEWLIASRRWHLYAARALFVLVLLAGIGVVWRAEIANRVGSLNSAQASAAASVFFTIVGTQLVLVMLAAPAAAAGSICLDKARGTLTHVLMTDLSNSEIVLGKLAARLVPLFGLIACSMPVVLLCSLMGGIDPTSLLGAYLVTAGVGVLGCALALTLSVWARKTHEVLMAVYLILAAWMLLRPVNRMIMFAFGTAWWPLYWADLINPFEVAFGGYWSPGGTGLADQFVFLIGALAISAALAALATWKVRAVASRQAGGQRRRGRALRRLGALWTEARARRPRWLRLPAAGLVVNALLAALAVCLFAVCLLGAFFQDDAVGASRAFAFGAIPFLAWQARRQAVRLVGRPLDFLRMPGVAASRDGSTVLGRLFRPSLDRNPVTWREWRAGRPKGWSRLIWGLYATASVAFTALGIWIGVTAPGGIIMEIPMVINAFQVAVGLLLLSVTAATALAEERVRGGLDVLLTTPLTTAEIVWGKWWGTYRAPSGWPSCRGWWRSPRRSPRSLTT